MHKNALFLLKKSTSAGALPPDLFASGGWGLCNQTPNGLPAAGGSSSDPYQPLSPSKISAYAYSTP